MEFRENWRGLMNKQKKIVTTRWEVIENYVKGKDVFDVGCAELIGTTTDGKKKSRWIHDKIAKVAKNLIGIDINEKQVILLKEMGYNIIVGDVTTVDLKRKFDVIVAGELIEHLSNPGIFLDNMKRHLKKEGVLILTTPNRFDFITFVKSFFHNSIPDYNKPISKHVMYFDENSISALLKRHGFESIEIVYYWTFAKDYDSRWTRMLLRLVIRFRPSFVRGIVVVSKVLK